MWNSSEALVLDINGAISPATVNIVKMTHFKGSPYRRANDLEAGGSRSADVDDEESSSDPFYIASTKNASIDRLKRWRVIFSISLSSFSVYNLLFMFLQSKLLDSPLILVSCVY